MVYLILVFCGCFWCLLEPQTGFDDIMLLFVLFVNSSRRKILITFPMLDLICVPYLVIHVYTVGPVVILKVLHTKAENLYMQGYLSLLSSSNYTNEYK